MTSTEGAETEAPEAPPVEPDFSHLIVAFTHRSKVDTKHHINFYKVIELADGTHSVFDFKLDAIQASLGNKAPGFPQASFQFGSFAWTETNSDGADMLKQVRICNSRESYNAELQVCEPCPDGTKGTTGF